MNFTNLRTIEIGEGVNVNTQINIDNINRAICHPALFHHFKQDKVKQLVIPSWVTSLTMLTDIHIHSLTKLTSLIIPSHLNSYNLTSVIDSLKHLECNVNFVSSISTSKIVSLTSLHINGNGEITNEMMKPFVNLKKIVISDSVTIGNKQSPFDKNTDLEELHCSLNITDKFKKCKKLTKLCILNKSQSTQMNAANNLISLTHFGKLSEIECSYDDVNKINVTQLIKLTINEGCEKISQEQFKEFTNIKELILPNSLTEIDNEAFKKHSNIISLECKPKFLKHFDLNKLTKYCVPNGVTGIHSVDVQECAELQSIIIPESVVFIESKAFDFSQKITELICDRKWYNKFNIYQFTINISEKTIEKGIYNDWNTVNKIIINGNNGIIKSEAFKSCKSLKEVHLKGNFDNIEK